MDFKLPRRKAPGLDYVPNEVARARPAMLLNVFNKYLSRDGYFPGQVEGYEVGSFVQKNARPLTEISIYRPLSLLDGISKLFELT